MSSNNNPDEQWEDIVRRLGGSSDQANSEPVAEPAHTPQPPDYWTDAGPRDYAVAEEIVEDFQPPDPKPITTGHPRTVLSWTGVIGAVMIWLFAAFVSFPLPWWLTTATVVAFLAGAVSLFFLLPRTRTHHDPDDDDDYGDGAKL